MALSITPPPGEEPLDEREDVLLPFVDAEPEPYRGLEPLGLEALAGMVMMLPAPAATAVQTSGGCCGRRCWCCSAQQGEEKARRRDASARLDKLRFEEEVEEQEDEDDLATRLLMGFLDLCEVAIDCCRMR